MAMMAGKLYTALRAANVPDGDAMAAAEEAGSQDGRVQKIETDLGILKWMTGTVIVLLLGQIGIVTAFAINHATFH